MKNPFDSPDQSPDMFAPPKKGPGGKRMNHRLASIFLFFAIVIVVVVVYGIDDKAKSESLANEAALEKGKGTGPATVPIERPQGPDVDPIQVITQIPVQPAAVPTLPQEQSLAPVLSEAEKKKIAEFEASMKASSRVQGTNMSQRGQQLQTQPQQNEQSAQRGPNLVPPPPPPQYAEDGGPTDINKNAEKQAFLDQRDDSDTYLKHTRMPPRGKYELKAGSVIPITTITHFNTNVPGGLVVVQVRKNVYDTATHQHLLIPAGSKVHGVGGSNLAAGQVRAMFAYQRIVFPDGSSLILDSMPAMGSDGAAGLEGEVDNHYFRIFGQAIAVSLFSAASQVAQPQPVNGNFNASQILAAQVGMQGFNLGANLMRRNLNIQQTIEVPQLTEGNIGVMKDIVFDEPWSDQRLVRKVSRMEE